MHKHPIYAQMLISPIRFLQYAMLIPYYHHERWDGSGYPLGLRGADIPLEARIFAVVDVWDALRSDRPYRKALSDEETIQYILEQSDKHFDPEVVNVFMKLIEKDYQG
jgi:HD-GYP domain-containing protein (c-di-GMP phosphodiesterase class II)